MPEEDRVTDTGNKHKKLVKIARVVPEISSRTDRHIDRHIYSSQYLTTDPAVEVTTVRFDSILFVAVLSSFSFVPRNANKF